MTWDADVGLSLKRALMLGVCWSLLTVMTAPVVAARFEKNGTVSKAEQEKMRSTGLPVLVFGAAPLYPRDLASKEARGCVTVQFTIGEDGVPDSFVILDSDPPGRFDQAALQALFHWRFERQARPVPAIQTFKFQMRQGVGTHIQATPAPDCIAPVGTFVAMASEKPGIKVLQYRRPYFPPTLAKSKKSGCVAISFEVTTEGLADNYEVLPPATATEFAKAAIWALNQLRFEKGAGEGRTAAITRFYDLRDDPQTIDCALPKGFTEQVVLPRSEDA